MARTGRGIAFMMDMTFCVICDHGYSLERQGFRTGRSEGKRQGGACRF